MNMYICMYVNSVCMCVCVYVCYVFGHMYLRMYSDSGDEKRDVTVLCRREMMCGIPSRFLFLTSMQDSS